MVLSYLWASFINNNSGQVCDIALMRIERDETAKAYFDEIIDEFASIKARKVLFCFNQHFCVI